MIAQIDIDVDQCTIIKRSILFTLLDATEMNN